MEQLRGITRTDLDWGLSLAPTLEWTYARTMPECPHQYVVLPRTRGLAPEDFVRAARVIHTFGEPGGCHSSTNIYLSLPGMRWKFWTMDADLRDTKPHQRLHDRVGYARRTHR